MLLVSIDHINFESQLKFYILKYAYLSYSNGILKLNMSPEPNMDPNTCVIFLTGVWVMTSLDLTYHQNLTWTPIQFVRRTLLYHQHNMNCVMRILTLWRQQFRGYRSQSMSVNINSEAIGGTVRPWRKRTRIHTKVHYWVKVLIMFISGGMIGG